MWRRIQQIQDPELKELSEWLPFSVYSCHADSTNKKYKYMFNRWKDWAVKFDGVSCVPADCLYVTLFVIHIARTTSSASLVKSIVPAVCWGHRFVDLKFQADNQLLRDTVAGWVRVLSKPRNPKEPISAEHVKQLIDTVDFTDLMDLRVVTMICLGFFGFLRFSELVSIRRSDVSCSGSHLKIVIRKSKTDQLREGNAVLISMLEPRYCPVSLVHIYFAMASIADDADCYIFRNIQGATRRTQKLRIKDQHMTYTRTREIVLKKLKTLGLNVKKFGLHSLRAGGATEAARRGVPDRLFQRHGRWATATCKNMYIKDDVCAMLSVSQKLGI